MTVEQMEVWFQKHRSDKDYQHRNMSLEAMDVQAQKSFFKLKESLQAKVIDVCRAYKIIDKENSSESYIRMMRYRYMAQTNLFALCHLLEKYKDVSDQTYTWIDGTTHDTHQEICNEFFVAKNPVVKTFKEFANAYVGQKQRLLLVPRGGFKSSIDMADTVQWILNYPEVTIIILTGVLKLANDFVGEIKSHFTLEEGTADGLAANLYHTKKPLRPRTMDDDTPLMFQVLFAEHCTFEDDGKESEFQTPATSATGTGCTVWAASIDQNLSGWHAGIMKLDDVVTNENSRTTDRIININKQVSINNAMLHPYGFYDKIGTWYDQEDTYGQDMKHIKFCEKNGDPVPMKVYLRPCWWPNAAAVKAGKVESEMTENDWELWFNVPGQLTYQFLRSKMHDIEGFAIKYLNDPTKAHTVKFPRELLERRTIHSNQLPQAGLRVTCVDTAYSTKSWADYTVIITALIYGGRFYIIDMQRGRFNEYELPVKIATVAHQWRPSRICIEDSVGVKWLGKEIYREMDKLKTRVPLEFISLGKGSKASAKDVKAKPVLRFLGDERLLFANQCVGLEELYTELAAFGTAASTHDDIVSALSILVDQFASYADMEGRKQEASPDFVISSQAKQQYDHIYGLGVFEKCFTQRSFNAAMNNPEVPVQEAVRTEETAGLGGFNTDPFADAGLY
jgi:phage terminase large subunit-like protein